MPWQELPLNEPGAEWPLLLPGVESRYISSFDRSGGNSDGFTGEYSALYRLPSGEHVIFDASGPGVLQTLWFTGPREGGEGLDLGRLRFYFDDARAPAVETTAERLFGGQDPRFPADLVAHNKQSTGGFASWVPMPFQGRLIITTERRASFYIAQYDIYPFNTRVESWRETSAPARARLFRSVLRGRWPRPAAALRQVALDYQHRGAGTVELLRFEPQAGFAAEALHRARIKVFWDGEEHPSIEAPPGRPGFAVPLKDGPTGPRSLTPSSSTRAPRASPCSSSPITRAVSCGGPSTSARGASVPG